MPDSQQRANQYQMEGYEQPPYTRLQREFFARDTTIVARESLGKVLVRTTPSGLLMARIVETEAYLGEHDPAAHASFGRTKRTSVLYGEPGHAYIFQLRAYHCLNFVAEPVGSPGCVLIRALEPLNGVEHMRELRGRANLPYTRIADGPGKLCRAMDIDMAMYGTDLVGPASLLQVWEPAEALEPEIDVSRRIGITKAADWELRFTIRGNPYVSSDRYKRLPRSVSTRQKTTAEQH